MGIHHQANHGRVFRGLDAKEHLEAQKRDSHGSHVKMNVPHNVKAAARPANPYQRKYMVDDKDADVQTVESVVYVTMTPTFTGSVAGYTTLNEISATPTDVAQSAATATAASSSASLNDAEASYASAKSAASNRGSTTLAASSTVIASPVPTVSSTISSETDDGSNNKSNFLNPAKATSAVTTATAAAALVGSGVQTTRGATAIVGSGVQATRAAQISQSNSGMSGGAKAGMAIGILAVLALAAGLLFFCWRRRKNPDAHQEIIDEKRSNSMFGGRAVSEKHSRVSSEHSAHTAATAPRLSLRPVTQFLPSLAKKRQSNATLDPAAAAMSEKPKSMWERRSNTSENPFADSETPAHDPFDEPEAIVEGRKSPSHKSTHSAKNSWEGSEPPTPKSTKFGTAEAVSVAAATATPPVPTHNNVHRVQLDFKPSMEDELELKSGQLVRVLHEYDDGWALCMRMDRSQQGVTPRTCLSKLPVKPRGPPSNGSNERPVTPQGSSGMVPRPLTPTGRERSGSNADAERPNTPNGSMPARKPVPATLAPSPNNTSPQNAPTARRVASFSETAVNVGYLDRGWLLNNLRALNQVSEPELNDAQLYDIREAVLGEVAHCIGRPIPEVFEQISPILATAVLYAKYPNDQERRESEMATPLLGQFLAAMNGFIVARNEKSISEWIALEPPFNEHYLSMIQELKQTYPKGSEDALEQKCSQTLKAALDGDDGSPWTSFVKFMVQYLAYLRDVSADVSRYLETYALLSEMQQRANSALGHGTLGHLILPMVVANAKLVCRLAIGLDKQPELIAHLKSGQSGGEDGPRETLPERAANILRQAFVTCLNDRVSGLSTDGKPEGKKRGIYIIANLCLKILFQCRKTRNATQIFENIYNLSPPLSAYPKRERVTYLYYLGRFLFQNSHFYRAQEALQYAYDESPARPECARQRRHILIYLIASNIILGRFPSDAILNRLEAQGLRERFLPLCWAIQQGNLAAFQEHMDFNSPNAEWFLHFRILLQLRNRCEVLAWRSLVRKTWLFNGTRPPPDSRVAPQVGIADLVAAFEWSEKHAGSSHDDEHTDPDFHDIDYGDIDDAIDETAIESKLAALIDQGLINGFIAHTKGKFAITGVKSKGGDVLAAGFPEPWAVLKGKVEKFGEDEVPGWKKQQAGAGGAVKPGPGMVFNFTGMKPIGAAG